MNIGCRDFPTFRSIRPTSLPHAAGPTATCTRGSPPCRRPPTVHCGILWAPRQVLQRARASERWRVNEVGGPGALAQHRGPGRAARNADRGPVRAASPQPLGRERGPADLGRRPAGLWASMRVPLCGSAAGGLPGRLHERSGGMVAVGDRLISSGGRVARQRVSVALGGAEFARGRHFRGASRASFLRTATPREGRARGSCASGRPAVSVGNWSVIVLMTLLLLLTSCQAAVRALARSACVGPV